MDLDCVAGPHGRVSRPIRRPEALRLGALRRAGYRYSMNAECGAQVALLGRVLMDVFVLAGVVVALPAGSLTAQQPDDARLPEIRQLLEQVREHQRQLDKVRENYTYTSAQTLQDIDANGQVKKTETSESEVFFVNSHAVSRMVKKDGKPLDEHEQQKETERVTKEAQKAQNTPPDQQVEGEQQVSITKTLELMDVRNPRREIYRGRPAIVFDFVGRKDAKTHGIIEDASKKLEGTLWIDEAGRQVAHLDVRFIDNFRVAGGLVATIQKGSNFHFDQSPVNGELWLPTGAEATVAARVLLVKSLRQHFTERDYDFKRFHVETQTGKDAKALTGANPDGAKP